MKNNIEIPKIFKKIYVLIADNKLGDSNYSYKTKGIFKSLCRFSSDLKDWSIEVDTVSDPYELLKYMQLNPVDIILFDVNFLPKKNVLEQNSQINETDIENNIGEFLFTEQLYGSGLDLYKYLDNFSKYIPEKKPFFDKYIFTYYEPDVLEELLKKSNYSYSLSDITNVDINYFNAETYKSTENNNNDTISKLLFFKKSVSFKTLVSLIIKCKKRIETWFHKNDNNNYYQLYRYVEYKLYFRDFKSEFLYCINSENGLNKLDNFFNNKHKFDIYKFSFPNWTIYGLGRKYPEYLETLKPDLGLLFSFPPNKKTENLTPINEYKGSGAKKIFDNFLYFLKTNITDEFKTIYNWVIVDDKLKEYVKHNVYNIFLNKESTTNKKNTENSDKEYKFGRFSFSSPLWLSATPLTGSTLPGNEDEVIAHFVSKIRYFLSFDIGAAIIKTVFPKAEHNKNKSSYWANEKMYLNNQARCYRENSGKKTNYYNTGPTASIAFTPEMMQKILIKMLEYKDLHKKIIPSLGALSTDKNTWEELFKSVFQHKEIEDKYELVEINVRHAIRNIARASRLGGDEYFHSLSHNNSIKTTIKELPQFYFKFENWLDALLEISNKFNKKLILKFPYRIDLFIFLSICNSKKENKIEGIEGITLINTYKSPYIFCKEKKINSTFDKYLSIYDKQDKIMCPQLSGYNLSTIRNYILNLLGNNKDFKLDISATGGVMSEDDIKQCFAFGAKSIQLGTILLESNLDLKKTIDNFNVFKNYSNKEKYAFNENNLIFRKVVFSENKCIRCGKCYTSFYCDAFLNRGSLSEKIVKYESKFYDLKYPVIFYDACVGCGLCVQLCQSGALQLVKLDKKK